MLNKAMPENPIYGKFRDGFLFSNIHQLAKNMYFCAGEGRFAMNAGDVQCMLVEMCLFEGYI